MFIEDEITISPLRMIKHSNKYRSFMLEYVIRGTHRRSLCSCIYKYIDPESNIWDYLSADGTFFELLQVDKSIIRDYPELFDTNTMGNISDMFTSNIEIYNNKYNQSGILFCDIYSDELCYAEYNDSCNTLEFEPCDSSLSRNNYMYINITDRVFRTFEDMINYCVAVSSVYD